MTRYSEPEACFVVFILFGRELELQENWLYLRLCTSLKKCTKRTPSKAVCSGVKGIFSSSFVTMYTMQCYDDGPGHRPFYFCFFLLNNF